VIHTLDRHWAFCKLEHRDGLVPIANIAPLTRQEIPDLEEDQTIFMAQCTMIGEENLTVKKGTKNK